MPTEITTTNTAGGSVATADYCATFGPPIPLAVRSLFDVEVDGLLGFSLLPKNDLAKDLAGAWMHGVMKASLLGTMRARSILSGRSASMDVTALQVRVEPGIMLSSGGDPFYSSQTISAEERIIALAAIEAYRESKRPKTRKRRR